MVQLEEKLAAERIFRDGLRSALTTLATAFASGLSTDELKTVIDGIDGNVLAVGKAQFDVVQKIASELIAAIAKLSVTAQTNLKTATDQINTQLGIWVAEQKKTKDQIEDLRRELEKQKIKLDMAFIRKVTTDASTHAAKLIELNKSIPKQGAAYKVRSALLNERRELKSRIFMTRQAFASQMNKNLATCVVDYSVHLKFSEGVMSNELEELIKTTMNWRTSQVPKAALIAGKFSPITLLDAVDKNDIGALTAVVDENGNKVFSAKEAGEIIAKLGEWQPYVAIQRCIFEDRPAIQVTKMIALPTGKKVPNIKSFTKLSLGQQQSILLTLGELVLEKFWEPVTTLRLLPK